MMKDSCYGGRGVFWYYYYNICKMKNNFMACVFVNSCPPFHKKEPPMLEHNFSQRAPYEISRTIT